MVILRWRPVALLTIVCLLTSLPALAARGDKIYIALEDVTMHDAPSARSPRVLVLDRGHMVVEVASEGRWLKVAAARTGGIMGWVERRNLTTVRPAPQPPLPRPAFEYFVSSVERFNADVLAQTGHRLYRRIDAVTDDLINLTATPLWSRLPRLAMRRNLRLMADRWASLNGTGHPTWIQVIDERGEVLMRERRGS